LCALSLGLFTSIMFPVFFPLHPDRSTASAESASGLLCTAIVGGAVLPLLVGLVSEHSNYATAFTVPALCYATLCMFAVAAARKPKLPRAEPAAISLH